MNASEIVTLLKAGYTKEEIQAMADLPKREDSVPNDDEGAFAPSPSKDAENPFDKIAESFKALEMKMESVTKAVSDIQKMNVENATGGKSENDAKSIIDSYIKEYR